MNVSRIASLPVARQLPAAPVAARVAPVDRFERVTTNSSRQINHLSAALSPSLLGVLSGVPHSLVSVQAVALVAKLEIANDRRALRALDAEQAGDVVVAEHTPTEIRYVRAHSRVLVGRTVRA